MAQESKNELVLQYGTDIKVESEKMTVEFFVWDCPKCGRHNRSLEFYISNYTLWCNGCSKETKYSTELFFKNKTQSTDNQ